MNASELLLENPEERYVNSINVYSFLHVLCIRFFLFCISMYILLNTIYSFFHYSLTLQGRITHFRVVKNLNILHTLIIVPCKSILKMWLLASHEQVTAYIVTIPDVWSWIEKRSYMIRASSRSCNDFDRPKFKPYQKSDKI